MLTAIALILAGAALWIVLAERRQRRLERAWDMERDEQLAAINGRPHGNVTVLQAEPVNGYDTPEPEELA